MSFVGFSVMRAPLMASRAANKRLALALLRLRD